MLDVNGPAIATLHTRDADGLTIVQVRNASNGNFIRNVFPLGLGWSPQELRAIPDQNGNSADEIAVRMTRDTDGLEIIQIRDGLTQALISNVYPIGAGLSTWTTRKFRAVTTNGITALAILSTRHSDDQVLVQIKSIQTGAVANNVFFIGAPWEFQQDFAVAPNFNGGDDGEIAVLMRNTSTDQRFVQIRDSESDQVIRNVFQPNE
ncbi:MAG: hypothetical protein AAF438_05580 [Pseudomonadota bacterium]